MAGRLVSTASVVTICRLLVYAWFATERDSSVSVIPIQATGSDTPTEIVVRTKTNRIWLYLEGGTLNGTPLGRPPSTYWGAQL